MRDANSWSLSLGHCGGAQVRLHALFLLTGFGALYFASRGSGSIGFALLGIVILFASVLLHEFGHALAAWRLGANLDQVVIGPLGGMHHIGATQDPQRDLLIALSGPLANFLVCLVTVPALMALQVDLPSLLKNPFHPDALLEGGDGLVALKFVCWINCYLFLFNLLPAFPFDGGRVLRDILWPAFEYRHAGLFVARFGFFVALILCGVAALIEDDPVAVAPAWFILGLLVMLIVFQSRHEINRIEEFEVDEELFGYDFSQGYTSLERPHDAPRPRTGAFKQWLARRRAAKELRRRELEAEEERRVDDILVRLHRDGMSALSSDERALLDRVSARYRNRQQS